MQDQLVTKYLECQLTPTELTERRTDLCALMIELSEAEAKLDVSKRSIKRLNEARTVKTKVLERGSEMRAVECTMRLAGTRVQTYRNDSKELVEDRPATSEERQVGFGDFGEQITDGEATAAMQGDEVLEADMPEEKKTKRRPRTVAAYKGQGKRGRK